MRSPEVLDFAPERIVEPVRRRPFLAWLGSMLGDALLSLLLNALVVGWLARVGWPLRPVEASSPISVEIVDHMPGQAKGSKADTASDSAPGGAQHADAKPTTAAASKPAEPDASKPPAADERKVADAETAKAATAEAHEPEPADKSSATPATEAGADTAPTQATPTAKDVADAQPEKAEPPTTPAVPPPPEHPDNTAAPQLVEAPKPPAPTSGAGTATAAVPDRPAEPAGSPPAQPTVLSSPSAPDAVAPAAPPPETPPEPTAEEKRQAESTAKLAAALPFGPMGMGDPFAGRFASQGQTASQNYRGAVYGNFSKGNDLVEEARAKHMRGQAVIAFSIDQNGNLAAIAVAVSSGNPELDQTALELIRRAAPFPPPPPGAQRSFSPAIGFGLDQ